MAKKSKPTAKNKKAQVFDSVESALADLALGKMIIVVDDEDRENEGDLIIPAEYITHEHINFMSKHARGLICTPINEELAKRLELPPMVQGNTSNHSTAFTVSVDLKARTTTGISAFDRAETIRALLDENLGADDFLRPGHTFPLVAKKGGVLERRGHTEAAVDLSKLLGLKGPSVICEIMNEDGSMARMDDLFKFAERFELKIMTINDLVHFLEKRRQLLRPGTVVDFPTKFGHFTLLPFLSLVAKDKEHLALIKGDLSKKKIPLVRIHSECLTGDVFGSKRCDCGEQLDNSLAMIEKEKHGLVIYLRQEGRGIGLFKKLEAYALQDQGLDTVSANLRLGFAADLRSYREAAQILKFLGLEKVRLLTNNMEKVDGLTSEGIEVVERVPLLTEANEFNEFYLQVKKEKMNHLLDDHTHLS